MEYLLGKAQHTSLAPAEQDELRRYVQVAQPGAKDVTFETIVTLGLIQSSVRTCCIRISNLRRPPAPGTAPECCPLLRRVLCWYLCTGGLPVRPPGLRGPPGYPIVRAGYVQRGSLCRSPAAGRVFFPPYAAGDAILVAGVAAGGIRAANGLRYRFFPRTKRAYRISPGESVLSRIGAGSRGLTSPG